MLDAVHFRYELVRRVSLMLFVSQLNSISV